MGLWQESGAMQRHKFLGEAAEAPEIKRPNLLKDSSLYTIYLVSRLRLIAPCLQVPSHY